MSLSVKDRRGRADRVLVFWEDQAYSVKTMYIVYLVHSLLSRKHFNDNQIIHGREDNLNEDRISKLPNKSS